MTEPQISREELTPPQGQHQMTHSEAIQKALTMIADLRVELNETRKMAHENRHLGNDTQVSIDQKLTALLESLKISSDSTHANNTVMIQAVEKATNSLSQVSAHPDGTISISSGPPRE